MTPRLITNSIPVYKEIIICIFAFGIILSLNYWFIKPKKHFILILASVLMVEVNRGEGERGMKVGDPRIILLCQNGNTGL